MRKRVSKAAKHCIGTGWCRQVRFNAEEDDVLAFAVAKIDEERRRRGHCRFKVGITHSPYFRFFNRKFGYACESPPWAHMEVLWVTMPKRCGSLEKSLISYYRARHSLGLTNIRNGDNSRPKFAPSFVYCVFGVATRGRR